MADWTRPGRKHGIGRRSRALSGYTPDKPRTVHRQFRITFNDDVPCDSSLMIRNLSIANRPSGSGEERAGRHLERKRNCRELPDRSSHSQCHVVAAVPFRWFNLL